MNLGRHCRWSDSFLFFFFWSKENCSFLSRPASFQFSSVAQSCPPLCGPMDCSTPGIPVSHHPLEHAQLMSIELVIPSKHLILCLPLLLLPSIFPRIRLFSNESALRIRWPKYWSFSFNINPSSEHPGLISLRMDWLDLLAVQGTLKSHPQYHSSKASILQHSAFFIVQLSHLYMTTGKTTALTRWTFVRVKKFCLPLFYIRVWMNTFSCSLS